MDFNILDQRIYASTLNTCHYIDGYEGANSVVTLHCDKHDLTFKTKYQNVNRINRAHHVCPECQKEDAEQRSAKITLKCDYCGQEFKRAPSKIDNSKSGLHFCCREHKDLAQRLGSGEEFLKMRPDHYGTTVSDYRTLAFRTYPHKCAVCGWDEDEDVLQVHHIDSNHNNNDINNLMILCPICHSKITIKKYKLIDNKLYKVK